MSKLTLFVFIDALGWEVLKDRKFLAYELPYRRKLRSVFGYSSACVPSILSGLQPREHGHWSFYFVNESNSPFKGYRWLRFIPFQQRGRVRNYLSRWLKRRLGWSGYFQLYNMPFPYLDRFDYCEKRDIFAPNGINQGEQIFEQLEQKNIAFHVSDWRLSEAENLASLQNDIETKKPRFAFLYMADMDALLHRVGKEDESVDAKLAWYEYQLREVLATADSHYDQVDTFVCSDHGMSTVKQSVDLMSCIEALPYQYGKHYLAAYDSTMARFWFRSSSAKNEITDLLAKNEHGRILTQQELIDLGCDFENHKYGETIFLLDPGKIICPSHMGTKPVTGMHGYHPDDADSDAVLLSSKAPATNPLSITDLNLLMQTEAAST